MQTTYSDDDASDYGNASGCHCDGDAHHCHQSCHPHQHRRGLEVAGEGVGAGNCDGDEEAVVACAGDGEESSEECYHQPHQEVQLQESTRDCHMSCTLPAQAPSVDGIPFKIKCSPSYYIIAFCILHLAKRQLTQYQDSRIGIA